MWVRVALHDSPVACRVCTLRRGRSAGLGGSSSRPTTTSGCQFAPTPVKYGIYPWIATVTQGVSSQIQRGVNGSLCVPGRALAGSSSPPHRQRTAPPSRPRTAPPGRRGTSRCRWASSAHARRVRARSLGAETTPDNNHHTKYSRIIAGCCSVACDSKGIKLPSQTTETDHTVHVGAGGVA